MKLLSFLKSNQFALWVAILSVAVQSFHSFTAFYNSSSLQGSPWGIAQAALFAVVIDLAILFYTLRNRKDVALGAAAVMVIINAYYYYQHMGLGFEFVFGVFLSLIIPASVYFYSEEIKEDEDSKVSEWKREYAALNTAYTNLNKITESTAEDRDRLKKDFDAISSSAAEWRVGYNKLQDDLALGKQMYDQVVKERDKLREDVARLQTAEPSDKSLLNISSDADDNVTANDAGKYSFNKPQRPVTNTNGPVLE